MDRTGIGQTILHAHEELAGGNQHHLPGRCQSLIDESLELFLLACQQLSIHAINRFVSGQGNRLMDRSGRHWDTGDGRLGTVPAIGRRRHRCGVNDRGRPFGHAHGFDPHGRPREFRDQITVALSLGRPPSPPADGGEIEIRDVG